MFNNEDVCPAKRARIHNDIAVNIRTNRSGSRKTRCEQRKDNKQQQQKIVLETNADVV